MDDKIPLHPDTVDAIQEVFVGKKCVKCDEQAAHINRSKFYCSSCNRGKPWLAGSSQPKPELTRFDRFFDVNIICVPLELHEHVEGHLHENRWYDGYGEPLKIK